MEFINHEDPLLAMLEWLARQLMQIEAEGKVGASKGKHSPKRRAYFSGKKVKRFLLINSLILFFIARVTARLGRTENYLIR
ncbi:MAG: hypothetical protein DRJ06_04140 [Candidatus Aminicenantes bacterium]|nr:MAG: hypothetical protein DRJ06_04140 [Candidatus Aminicenantes bacterium]